MRFLREKRILAIALVVAIAAIAVGLLLENLQPNQTKYKTNDYGESYGAVTDVDPLTSGEDFSSYFDRLPDLIAAVASNGREGYVRKEDVYVPLNLEEGVMKTGSFDHEIDVYLEDGRTVVGVLA